MIIFMIMWDFVARHIVWGLPIAALVLFLAMPSVFFAIWTFLTRTLPGQIILACLATGLAVWFVRGFVDDAANRTQAIVAARNETKRAEAERRETEARLAELRRQVEASNALLADATDRAQTNEAAIAAYQDRETAYEAELDKGPAAPACALDSADVRSLRAAAGAFGPGAKPSRSSAGAGKLRPARPGP